MAHGGPLPGLVMTRGRTITLTRPERESLCMLLYNACSQDLWPAGIPEAPSPGEGLRDLAGVLPKVQRMQRLDPRHPDHDPSLLQGPPVPSGSRGHGMGRQRTFLSLSRDERAALLALLRGVCAPGPWPSGLDIPHSPEQWRDALRAVHRKLE